MLFRSPFSCTHHHHANDLCEYNDELYLSSFSYCHDGKNEILKGAINKLDDNFHVVSSIETMPSPHSLCVFEDRLFFCSSGTSSVLSLNLNNNSHKLEIKCLEAWARGLLCTPNFFYLGYSAGNGRTKSVFTNDYGSIMKFNKTTGESKIFQTPFPNDNVYSILGIHEL